MTAAAPVESRRRRYFCDALAAIAIQCSPGLIPPEGVSALLCDESHRYQLQPPGISLAVGGSSQDAPGEN